jgi:hypothetical protein
MPNPSAPQWVRPDWQTKHFSHSISGVAALDRNLAVQVTDQTKLNALIALAAAEEVELEFSTTNPTPGGVPSPPAVALTSENFKTLLSGEYAPDAPPMKAALARVVDDNGLHRRMSVLDPNKVYADRAPAPLTIPTYDATGQSNHPDVLYFPSGFGSDSNGKSWKYWMVTTPLAGDDNSLENPSILVSDDGTTWIAPPGLTNPIAPKPAGTGNYNSDPDLEQGPDGKLYCFYRPVLSTAEEVCYRTSSDGITWSAETVAFSSTSTTKAVLSPTIVWDPSVNLWRMWVVNGVGGTPFLIQQRTAAALTGPWSAPVNCTYTMPAGPTGIAQDPWHIDVVRVGSQMHMCINSTTAGGSGQSGFNWIAVSSDGGITWTIGSKPLTIRGGGGSYNRWDNEPYRACFVPVDSATGTTHRLYYSAKGSLGWRVGVTDLKTRAPMHLRTSEFLPEDYGLIGWTHDPAEAVGSTNTLAAGQPTFYLLRAAVDGYVDSVFMNCTLAGATLTSGQNFLGLYDMSGNQLAVSADLSTTWTSTGNRQYAFTAPTRLITAGERLALVVLANGTTLPKFAGLANPQAININRAATPSSAGATTSPYRSGTLGSALTALPATVTFSSAGQANWCPFVGLSPATSI